jgi:hypothetical protein
MAVVESTPRLDPRRARPHESLPLDLFRNAQGFLIRDTVSITADTLNMGQIAYETEFLKEHVVILQCVKECGRPSNGGGWL